MHRKYNELRYKWLKLVAPLGVALTADDSTDTDVEMVEVGHTSGVGMDALLTTDDSGGSVQDPKNAVPDVSANTSDVLI